MVPASLQPTPGRSETPERRPAALLCPGGGTCPATALTTMTHSSRKPALDDVLAQRAQELEVLRHDEHQSAFNGDVREMTGEASRVGQHPADVADFTYQRELQQTTELLLEREAKQVEAALRARETGTYGTCVGCRRPIPTERMAARPEATLCVDCQRHREGGGS